MQVEGSHSRHEPTQPSWGVSKQGPSRNYLVLLPSNMRLDSLIHVLFSIQNGNASNEVLGQRHYVRPMLPTHRLQTVTGLDSIETQRKHKYLEQFDGVAL